MFGLGFGGCGLGVSGSGWLSIPKDELQKASGSPASVLF